MKQVMSFTVKFSKPRNVVAQDMFDRNGEFKPRTNKSKMTYKRKPKNAREFQQDFE